MRSKLFSPFEWGIKRASLWTTLALLLLSAWQLPAQTTIITNNSFASLQNAVAAGGSYFLSFNGVVSATSPLLVTNNVTLFTSSTNTVTISGNNSNRIFQVSSNVTLTISNLTLSGGNNISSNGATGANGTTINGGSKGTTGGSGGSGTNGFGGAIYNQGTTLAYYCIFLTNSATGSAGGAGGGGGNGSFTGGSGGNGGSGGTGLGGAIYNLNILVVSNCTFAGNDAVGGSGGLGGTNGTGTSAYPGVGGTGGIAAGAGIYNLGVATIVGCTFEFNFSEGGNSQAAGPPIANQNGSAGPAGAFAEGGGIYNLGTNTIINCTFSQNLAVGGNGGNGGNIGNGGATGGNGGNGGSAFGGNLFNDTGGYVGVTNCTFAGGESFGGTNGIGGPGSHGSGNPGSPGVGYGANVANSGTFKLKNSILAYPTNALNAYGTITDQGYNISSDGTPTLTPTNSHNNLDPKLLALATNGGPTLTMALAVGSPAIDAIYDASAPNIDQRGSSRPYGLRSDIGAFEYGTNTYSLSGQVTLNGNGDSGVIVTLSGGSSSSVQPGADGTYSFSGLAAGSYTITPQQSGYTFNPSNVTVTLPPTTNNVNFTATTVPNTVSGQVTIAGSGGYSNLTVVALGTNGISYTNVTDTSGNYTFTNLAAGSNTITPQATAGVTFAPTNATVMLPIATNVNFVATVPKYSLDVQVMFGTNAYSNEVIVISGPSSSTNHTGANGHYIFTNLLAGNYTVTPQSVSGATINPPNATVNLPPSTNAAFTITIATYSVFGHISLGSNGYANVTVQASGTNAYNNTSLYSTQTDNGGDYYLANLPGGTYTITPLPSGFFMPSGAFISVPVGTNVDFVGLTATNSTIVLTRTSSSVVKLSVSGISNTTYRIQASANVPGGWQDIGTNTTGTNGTFVFFTPTTGFTNRFYRVVTP